MYESFGLIGIQLPEKYKENFDVSSEGEATCTVIVCIQYSYLTFYTIVPNTTYTINSDRRVKFKFSAHI
jgi:hypothetical protein